jgi:hypothetical protein
VVERGTAFIRDGHVWFVLSDPGHSSGWVLCVNLTTYGPHCYDNECFLTPDDYDWIKPGHKTVVAFSRAKFYRVDKLKYALESGALRQPKQKLVPLETVSKVAIIAKTSREVSPDMLHILKSN